MRRLFFLFITTVFLCAGVSAQRTDLRKVAERYKTVKTLTAHVTQVRHNAALTEDFVEEGYFYYKEPDKQSMIFKKAGEMLLATGDSFVMVKNGRQHVAKAKGKGDNPFEVLQDVFRNLLLADNRAVLTDMADVKLEKRGNICTITITPHVGANSKAKRRMIFTSCVATVDLVAAELRSLRINERGMNYTQYEFSNYVLDAEVGSSVFDVSTVM